MRIGCCLACFRRPRLALRAALLRVVVSLGCFLPVFVKSGCFLRIFISVGLLFQDNQVVIDTSIEVQKHLIEDFGLLIREVGFA